MDYLSTDTHLRSNWAQHGATMLIEISSDGAIWWLQINTLALNQTSNHETDDIAITRTLSS